MEDARQRPELDFVLPGLLCGTVGLIVGQGAIGKSFLALQIASAVALGRAVGTGGSGESLFEAPAKCGKVVAVFGEDPPAILQDRLNSLRQDLGEIESARLDLEAEFNSATGPDDDLRVIVKRAGGEISRGPFADRLATMAEGRRVAVLDPLALFIAGCEENDNGYMTYFMRTLGGIAQQTGCSILVLHHAGKGRDSDGEEWEKSRGASALTTAARLQLNLRPPTHKEAYDLGIDEGQRGFWVRVAQVKANYATPRAPQWAKRGHDGLLRAVKPQVMRPLPAVAKAGRRNGA